MAPAVTPWFSSLPGAGANNPAFRIYDYDINTEEILDATYYSTLYISPSTVTTYFFLGGIIAFLEGNVTILYCFRTYYIDLDKLNKDNNTKWQKEYSMKEAYSIGLKEFFIFEYLRNRWLPRKLPKVSRESSKILYLL